MPRMFLASTISFYTNVIAVPPQLAEDWARVFNAVSSNLLAASALPPNDPSRRTAVTRAAKWYGGISQIIFRQPNRSTERSRIILGARLRQFLNGDYKLLITYWAQEVNAFRMKESPQSDTKAAPRAVVRDHDITRGLRQLEGFGCTKPDDPSFESRW